MKNRTITLIAIGWLLLIVAACQMVDEVEPVDVDFREPVIGELFYHPFTLDMIIDGPDCNTDPLATQGGDDAAGVESCIGPVHVEGVGYGAIDAGPYAARTEFIFDPVSCACGGNIRILYENPSNSYDFALHGHGKMDHSIMESDEIRFPLELLRFNGPYDPEGVFIGNLIVQRPQVMAKGQDGIVSVNAYIMGRFYPPGYPIETE